MAFELLNLIKFGLFTIFLIVTYVYFKKKDVIKTGYKVLAFIWFVFFLLAFNSFYTLHEQVDVETNANNMMQSTGVITDKLSLEAYLNSQRKRPVISLEDELAKRKKLAEQEATIEIDQRVRLAKAETIRLENMKLAQGMNPMLLEYRKMELEELRLEVDLEFTKAAKNSGNSVIYYPVGQKPNYVETRMGQMK